MIPLTYGVHTASGNSDTNVEFIKFGMSATGSDYTAGETVTSDGLGSPNAVVTGYDIGNLNRNFPLTPAADFFLWVKNPVSASLFGVGQVLTGGSSALVAILPPLRRAV